MDEEASFYVTLESGGCMERYPSNTAANFTNDFANPYRLKGRWQVALRRISYEHSWKTVEKEMHAALLVWRRDNKGIEHFRVMTHTEPTPLLPNRATYPKEPSVNSDEMRATDRESVQFGGPNEIFVHDYLEVGQWEPRSVDMLVATIPAGMYEKPELLAQALCQEFRRVAEKIEPYQTAERIEPLKYRYNENLDRFEFIPQVDRSKLVFFRDKLGDRLGFPAESATRAEEKYYVYDLRSNALAVRTPMRHSIKDFYVYLPNVLRLEAVGGQDCSLLQMVRPEAKYGAREVALFDTMDWKYIRPDVTEFRELSLAIRDQKGEFVKFQVGTVSATLIFRRAR